MHEETVMAPVAEPEIEGIPEPQVNEEQKNRCPGCGTPFSVGDLGVGTTIKVKCKRGRCPFHQKPFTLIVR